MQDTYRLANAKTQAIWIFDWLNGLKGALPGELISEKHFPKTYAWIARFNSVLQGAKSQAPKPATLKGDIAAQRIFNASYAENDLGVDQMDPLGLQQGASVEVFPMDSGSRHHDRGSLIGLSEDEVVLSVQAEGQVVHVHYPRTGFRIKSIATEGNPKL